MASPVITLGAGTQSAEFRDRRFTLPGSIGRHYRQRPASDSSERTTHSNDENGRNRGFRGRLKSLSGMVNGLRGRHRPSSDCSSSAQEVAQANDVMSEDPFETRPSNDDDGGEIHAPPVPPRGAHRIRDRNGARPPLQRLPSAPAPSRPLPPTPTARSASLDCQVDIQDLDERPFVRPRRAQSLVGRSANRSASLTPRFLQSSSFDLDTSLLARARSDVDSRAGNVYEDPSALERAFGPMQDVARWYSTSIYSRLPRTASGQSRASRVCTCAASARGDPSLCVCQRPMPARPADNFELPSDFVVPDCLTKTINGKAVTRPRQWPAGLTSCLRELASHGWYWGPITRTEAEEMIGGRPDGTFLVRDSSDDRYLLSLTFRSQGKTLHTRVEHFQGYFSFYQNPSQAGRADTIAELIQKCMHQSRGGAFCYSRTVNGTSSAIPVRLVAPHSRFRYLRSLQQHCRFVIRQHTRYDLITELPISKPMKEFVRQSPFR